MNYNSNMKGSQIDLSVQSSDITVADITARDALITTNFTVGKKCHVNNNENSQKQTYYWTGATWADSILDFVDFNTTITIVPQEGRVGWNSEEETLSIGLSSDVTLQLGQEMYIKARNRSGGTINNGYAVFIDGASGDRIDVTMGNAGDVTATKTIAVCTQTTVANNAFGFFTTHGLVNDLNTTAMGVGVAEGDLLYLSSTTDGMLTNVLPVKPNYTISVGYVVRVHNSQGIIFVKTANIPKIGELSDVDTTGLTNGDQIYYDGSSTTWKRIEAGFNAISRWDDIALSADALRQGASAPDIVAIPNTGLTIRAFNGGGTTEELDGIWEIMHNTKLNTLLRPHLHWCPTTSNTGNVKWQLEYSIADVGGTINSSTIISATDSADGVAWQHLVFEFPTIDITGYNIGAQIKFRLFRNPSDASDTYGDDAGVLSYGVHYEIDGDGSRGVFFK